ncbi:MAG: hypothetical protein U0031_04560 [Thermomicrobiales bacterium]
MAKKHVLPVIGAAALGLMLCFNSVGSVWAQTENATAEDGNSSPEATETPTVPNVPLGANLTPPVGITPPGPALITPPGTGQSGSSTVSMAPGTLTTGTAHEGRNARHEPEAAPDPASVPTCGDYPTWYDAQLALEAAVDDATRASLDPDGNTIACEEVMYP